MTFDDHYGEIYGSRWPSLKSALLAPETHKVLLKNPFPGLADYSLDEASLFPSSQVSPRAGDRVADFCSAPGGKLLSFLFAAIQNGLSVDDLDVQANDLSPDRIRRLKGVLHDCLPPDWIRRVQVRRGDAGLWGRRFPESFDFVLVDAPCSGERHLLHSPRELERWTVKSGKRLAVRQHALVCSALDSLKSGGRLIYATCSISPLENDGVVDRLQESREGRFQVKALSGAKGEPTKHGWIFLPDRGGAGPLYTAILEKL